MRTITTNMRRWKYFNNLYSIRLKLNLIEVAWHPLYIYTEITVNLCFQILSQNLPNNLLIPGLRWKYQINLEHFLGQKVRAQRMIHSCWITWRYFEAVYIGQAWENMSIKINNTPNKIGINLFINNLIGNSFRETVNKTINYKG